MLGMKDTLVVKENVSVRSTHCSADQGPDPAAVNVNGAVHGTYSCTVGTADYF